jgi:flagellar hook-associated protein 1 FlgK
MSSGIFGVALSGLNAAQIGMQTTGHNLSNVNTVGYSRQSVLQSQGAGQFTGAGFIGHGTNVSSIQRVYSDFLITQAQALQADAASSTT